LKRDTKRILYILRREIDILKKKSPLSPFVEVLVRVLLFGQACPLYDSVVQCIIFLKKRLFKYF